MNSERIALSEEMHDLWKNGEVREAREVGQQLVTLETSLFGADDVRVAARQRTLYLYSLELDELEAAGEHFEEYSRISRIHQGSWHETDAGHQREVFAAFLERPLVDRQTFFVLHRRLEQDLEAQRYRHALDAAEASAKIAQELVGDRHPFWVMEMLNIQVVQLASGDYDTVGAQLNRLQSILQQVEHPNHPSLAILLMLRADYLERVGERERALASTEAAIKQFEVSGATFMPEYTLTMSMQGGLLCLENEHRKALDPLRRAYEYAQKEGVPRHVRTNVIGNYLCYALQHVASLERATSQWATAERLLKEAHTRAVETWGEDNYRAVDLQLDLKLARSAQRWTPEELRKFEELESQAIEIRTHAAAGEQTQALRLAERRYSGLVTLLGETCAETLRARLSVLSLLIDAETADAASGQVEADQQADSLPLRQQLVDFEATLSKVLGTKHPEYGSACMKFARFLKSEDPKALEFARNAETAFRESMNLGTDEYVTALTLVGKLLARQQDQEAVEVLTSAIELWEARASRGSVSHCEALAELGTYYYEVGDTYEARPYLAEAVELLRANKTATLGLDLAVTSNYFANVSADRGEHEDALALYRESIHLFETSPWHSSAPHFQDSPTAYAYFYQWSLYNAANSLTAVGKYDQAEQLLTKLLNRFEEASLSPLDIYRSACYSLATVYARQDREEDARDTLARVAAAVEKHYSDAPLIAGELLLEEAELARNLGEAKTAIAKLDNAFELFREISRPDDLTAGDEDVFLRLMTRLIDAYEELDRWERAVDVRKLVRPFEEEFLADWPGLLAISEHELKVAEQVAPLDEASRQVIVNARRVTERVEKAAESNYAAIELTFIRDAEHLLTRTQEVLGKHNLAAIDLCEALAGYWEYRQEHARAFAYLTYAVQGNMQLFGANHFRPARTAMKAGKVIRHLGDYQKAREFDEYGTELLKLLEGEESIAFIEGQLELAYLHTDLKNYAAALPLARSAIDGYRHLWGEKNATYAQALSLLGTIHAGLGEPSLAQPFFRQSNEILSDLLETTDARVLYSFTQLAVATSWDPRNSNEARELFEQVIQKYQDSRQTHLTAYTELLVRYGEALLEWDAYSDAETVFTQALESKTKLDWLADDVWRALILSRLGTAQRQLSKLQEARANLQMASELQRKLHGIHSRMLGETLFQLAIVARLQGDFEASRANVTECLQIQHQSTGDVGELMSEESLSTLLRGEENPLDLLISLMVRSDPSPEEVANAFRWTFRRKGLALDLHCRLRSLQQSQSFDSATVERLARLRGLNQQVADLAIRQPAGLTADELQARREELARDIAELNSELALSLKSSGVSLPELHGTIEELRKQLAEGAVLIEFVRVERFISENNPVDSEPRYVAFLVTGAEQAEITFADLGSAEEIEELVEQLRSQTTQVPRLLRIASEGDLEERYREVAGSLFERLLQPFAEQLSDAKTLIIGPDAGLHKVPFAALVDPEQRYLIERMDVSYVSSSRDLLRSRGPPGKGTLVISDPNFDADVRSHVSALQQTGVIDPTERLGVTQLLTTRGDGELVLRSLRWTRLPSAKEEAADIVHLLDRSDFAPVQTFLGNEAVEEVLKTAQSPRILHLATHGFYVPLESELTTLGGEGRSEPLGFSLSRLRSDPNPLLRSGIVLAGANRIVSDERVSDSLEDGWVTAQEIARLDFSNTELIVLSACESGLGDVAADRGVQGLRRAFIHAGAHSVLTSLFEVPDSETRELMRGFYAAMMNSPNRRSALGRAQRSLIEQRREKAQAAHPFFWASFILLGTAE